MKIIILIVAILLPSISNILSQELKHRIILNAGFQSTSTAVVDESDNNASLVSRISTNPRFNLGYEHYLNEKSGIGLSIGYSTLSKYFTFEIDQNTQSSLSAQNLTWNEDIRLPSDQQFLNFQLSYIYEVFNQGRNKLSLIGGLYFRYVLFLNETYQAENMFFENEEDFSQAIGPIFFEAYTTYKRLTLQPNLAFRYERKTKYDNSYGLAFNFNIPFFKYYQANLTILPEDEDLKSSFNYYSRGGFLGVSLFYGIGFGLNEQRNK